MKTYIDCINEISADELYDGLLGHGLFVEKLPPIFTSEGFCTYSKGQKNPFKNSPHRYIYYEHMRNFNTPRPMGIPNPFAYELLCASLKENWIRISKHFKDKTRGEDFKTSRIHIRKITNSPMLFKMNYDNWSVDGSPEHDLLVGKNWLVKTDIANCFPSIYTHSIPWALVGKSTAKARREKKYWYNQIDHFTQNLNNGETHGLLIGPHASNLLSEIILTAIDQKLRKKWNYIRYIDDYTCYTDTREQVNQFIAELYWELRSYGLLLNQRKTEIFELPVAAEDQWKNIILALTRSGKSKSKNKARKRGTILNFTDMQIFFNTVLQQMGANKMNAAILSYALQVISEKELTESAKSYFQKMVMHYALIFPYIVPLLDQVLFETFEGKGEVKDEYINQLFSKSLKINHFEGAVFTVYFALKYNTKLLDFTSKLAIDSQDCLFMLLAYLYFKKENNNDEMIKLVDHAKHLADEDFDEYWLFVYEVLPPDSLKDEWETMKRANITFLKNEGIVGS